MASGTRSHAEGSAEPPHEETPDISVCESSPGKSVFIEDANTDGWIVSDLTVDVVR
ncbi:hypothetical protein [Salinigranum sp. GCM10025319]|uniref:hypothetical protein n=1 Tax=Salinigranum sp. GCM10025319 TaxID=3252687 RepID=UPI0036175872